MWQVTNYYVVSCVRSHFSAGSASARAAGKWSLEPFSRTCLPIHWIPYHTYTSIIHITTNQWVNPWPSNEKNGWICNIRVISLAYWAYHLHPHGWPGPFWVYKIRMMYRVSRQDCGLSKTLGFPTTNGMFPTPCSFPTNCIPWVSCLHFSDISCMDIVRSRQDSLFLDQVGPGRASPQPTKVGC